MKRKGFTLVELLVVIAIIALLMGVLMPALARVRQIAYRMVCGTNLKGIGNAMVLYSNDYDEAYPVAGGRQPVWPTGGPDEISEWDAEKEWTAFGISEGGSEAEATITSSFFLLVKHADVSTKQFVCKGDSGTKAFQLAGAPGGTDITDITEVWDFGMQPGRYCSYSYHMPYGGYAIYVGSSPGSPIAADRNPWFDKNAKSHLGDGDLIDPDCSQGRFSDPDDKWNAAAHQFDAQNVLYNDIHVGQEKSSNVGIESDNIWRHWPDVVDPTACQRQEGDDAPTYGDGPLSAEDAFLVNEDSDY
jgi:prepilin-type N-terminal cleavage/methylation domain-containing protein